LNILTFFTPAEMTNINIGADVVVVVDVLRGSTTIASAFKAGASKIIPCGDLEHAFRIQNELGHDKALLCGNINDEYIDGFNLGSSPLEFTPAVIQHKALIFCSPNITKALAIARHHQRILLGCFNNLNAVLECLGNPANLIVLCAGKNGHFSLEDAVCAGMMIQFLLNRTETEFSLNDAASTARYLFYRHHRDILGMLNQSAQGIFLSKLGYSQDIEYSARLNTLNIVPELSLGKDYIIPTVAVENILVAP